MTVEIFRLLATVATAVIAFFALRAAIQTYRASFRPVQRPALIQPNGVFRPTGLILKNIGKGPAVSVFLVEPEPSRGERWPSTHPGPVVRALDVIEPLGAYKPHSEFERIGRVVIAIPKQRQLRPNIAYRLLYQDLSARWHETTFTIEALDGGGHQVVTQILGPLKSWQHDYIGYLPREVRDKAQVVQDEQ
jgi:hypothetical protein